MEDAIPIAEKMLFSSTAGDAVEACTFLGTACQFEVPNALAGVRKALFQVFSRDQSVRTNVASVYKEIYLQSKEPNQSSRQKASTSVNGLIELLRGLQPGQSPALCQLICAWRANEELGDQELQVYILHIVVVGFCFFFQLFSKLLIPPLIVADNVGKILNEDSNDDARGQ